MLAKFLSLVLASLIILSAAQLPVWAAQPYDSGQPQSTTQEKTKVKPFALDLYKHGFGLKTMIDESSASNLFLTIHETGLTVDELELQAGWEYYLPAQFLVWKFYGGNGVQYRPSSASIVSYVLVGTEAFGIFFSEYGFTLENNSRQIVRSGIRVRF